MKLLIVDDDDIVRISVHNIVKEEGLGFDTIIEAASGDEAIKSALESLPDIIITDIRMPGVDGLSFIEQTKRSLQDSKFIILSGYDDFTYAQKAIKFGVCEYLLKPYSRDELVNLLKDYMDIIKNEKELKKSTESLRKLFYSGTGSSMDNLLDKAFKDAGNGSEDFLNHINNIVGDDIGGSLYAILYADIDQKDDLCKKIYSGDKDLMTFAVKNITSELASNTFKNVTFINSDYGIVTILSGNLSKQEFESKMNFLAEKTAYMIKKFLKHTTTICTSSTTQDFENIKRIYRECQETLQIRLFKGYGCILKSTMSALRNVEFSINGKNSEELLKSILSADEIRLNFEIEKIFDAIKSSYNLKPVSVKKAISKLIVYVYNGITVNGIDSNNAFHEDISCWDTINKIETMGELKNWVKDFMLKILDPVRQQKEEGKGKHVLRVLKYIDENYHNEISLEDVAQMINLNPNYFSELFKKEVGINFVEYIVNKRVEVAKCLISEKKLKINDVAKKVGYKNQDYFCKVFKKLTGVSPKKYK